MARKTYESRIEEAKAKIKEKPQNALREIGKLLTYAIRQKAGKSKKSRTYYLNGKKINVKPGRLKRSIGYWYRKKENDLIVGSKAFYAHFEEFGSSKNPKNPFIMPVVMQNKDMIQGLIMDALKELEKEE
ncbi:MAG: HK97 gp10 family phage protein [Candidatus Nanoarchaeia archaeon]|jgi:HK97 gp10 family phage protein|nr:HK97 gp10 family phage protein [Candidatus Nanoarchaeia archaeon]